MRDLSFVVGVVVILCAAACGGGKPIEKPVEEAERPEEQVPAEEKPAEEQENVEEQKPVEELVRDEEPPPPPSLFTELREEDPKNVLYDEIVAANMEKGYRSRIVIRKDNTWTVELPSGPIDGNLDAAQRKTFDKALKKTEVRADVPKGGTCAGLPSSNIEIRAKGKVAQYADQCAAEPSKSLAKLTALVHELVGAVM